MTEANTRVQPLEGVRILSIEQYGAGPFGTLFLSNLGAEVIKIEEPVHGDVSRSVGTYEVQTTDDLEPNLYFQALNLGKKSLTLDLKHPDGLRTFHRLVASADAVTSNLRGDVVGKLGLTYDRLQEHNPAIVCAHLTAYGRDDERASWPGYDYIMQAEAGYCSVTGEPGSPPTRFGLSIVDWMAGLATAIGLLSGVLRARQSKLGGDIDVNLFDVALYNLNYVGLWAMNAGFTPGKTLRGGHPAQAPSQIFKTQDGWIHIMAGSKEKFWRALCDVLGHPEWTHDPRFKLAAERSKQREKLTRLIDEALSTKPTQAWLDLMRGRIPVGPVLDVPQALASRYVAETGRIIDVPVGTKTPLRTLRSPVRWNQQTPRPAAAPALGRDTDAVLLEAGFAAVEIERLRSTGAI